MLLPLIFSDTMFDKNLVILAGDVGATKTNMALYRFQDKEYLSVKETQYKSRQFKSISEITKNFLRDLPLPDAACFGVAGPVLNGKAKLTNLPWDISDTDVASQTGIPCIHLINDLEANAYGLSLLRDTELETIHKGNANAHGNAAVIAPGTGLGEAGLFFDGEFYHPFATEGGHSDFAPRNKDDFELFEFLKDKYGHVSWERLVSGPGILNIYQFLRDVKKYPEPGWLADKMGSGDSAAIISGHTDHSDLCKDTMQIFVRYLAFESANLVLKLKATGGLYIGGGIAPRILGLICENRFGASFCSSGRLSPLLEKIPVKVIMNTRTALLGAAYYGANFSFSKTGVL